MIVIDASALVELLTDGRELAADVRDELIVDGEWAAPEHLIVEVASALRGLWLGGFCTDAEFDARMRILAKVEVAAYPVQALLPRIRTLASNMTAYDAAYVALAELLVAPLVTMDRKLARIPGSTAEVHLISSD